MRFDSAELSSDLTFAASVTMKRLETSAAWPTSSSVAGTIISIHSALVVMSTKCATTSAPITPADSASATLAFRRGSSTIRYTPAITNSSLVTIQPQVGATKKCSWRIDETECASVSTGGIAGDTGVTELVPTPAAGGPISTILSAYFAAGILPVSTS